MLCQNCNQNEATMYWKQTINGQTKEMHLCPACASKLGQNFQNPFGTWFDDPFFTQPSLFSVPFGQVSQLGGGRRCPTCGTQNRNCSVLDVWGSVRTVTEPLIIY